MLALAQMTNSWMGLLCHVLVAYGAKENVNNILYLSFALFSIYVHIHVIRVYVFITLFLKIRPCLAVA